MFLAVAWYYFNSLFPANLCRVWLSCISPVSKMLLVCDTMFHINMELKIHKDIYLCGTEGQHTFTLKGLWKCKCLLSDFLSAYFTCVLKTLVQCAGGTRRESRSVLLQCFLKEKKKQNKKSWQGRKGSTLIHIHISIYFTENSPQLLIHFEKSQVHFQECVPCFCIIMMLLCRVFLWLCVCVCVCGCS